MLDLSLFLPAQPKSSFNDDSTPIYLLDWILTLIIAIAFVFYFNRLVGTVFSFVFKIVIWKAYKVRINVESVKFSVLGGRIFAKNLTIVSVDQSISILNLNITWRYWLFKLSRLSNYFQESEDVLEPEKHLSNEDLPTSILVSLEGLEVFIHNRSYAYDSILQSLHDLLNTSSQESDTTADTKQFLDTNLRFRQRPNSDSTTSSSESAQRRGKLEQVECDSNSQGSPMSNNDDTNMHTGTKMPAKSPGLLVLLRLLPIKIRVKRGAVLMGNVSTPAIMVVSYKSASGIVDITNACSDSDNYRALHNFTFEKFQISFKTNISYDEDRYKEDQQTHNKQSYHYKGQAYIQQFQRALGIFRTISNKVFRRGKKSKDNLLPEDEWKGLRRYIDNQGDTNILRVFNDEEYAKNSLILDTISARINYYYDSPGLVRFGKKPNAFLNDFPEHGVEMELSMATIHYGPWADKQRVPLQRVFFPTLSRDSKPTSFDVSPNSVRQYSGFKVNVSVKDELVIRVPTREPSKDKELLRTNLQTNTKLSRSFGWLELKMREGSNFSQFTSYIATEQNGWPNKLSAYCTDIEVRTSVNHDIFFRADSHELNADVGFPLKWNGTPVWTFENFSTNGQLFFLREHTLLFSDIFSDFATGEPTPYELFKPFLYNINWRMNNYQIYLNVNDQNIINNPLDFSTNTYLSFKGTLLDIHISIPLNGSLSKSTTVSYDISTPRFELELDTPPWHTVEAFMKGSKVVGCSDNFTVEGCYNFYDSIEINASNYTEIRCVGDNISLIFHGFVIKYLFIIRENYFGDNIHFKNFEEYTNELDKEDLGDSATHTSASESYLVDNPKADGVDYWKIIKTDNDDDIFFSFQIRHGLAILPYYIYDTKSHIGLSFDYCDVDVRFTNYYMDLQADLSPIAGVYIDEEYQSDSDKVYDIQNYRELYVGKPNDICIDGLSIHAHRMFGIPPNEITYNAKWDFSSGLIEINSSPLFLMALKTSIKNFAFGFVDFENSLNVPEPHVYDAFNITFRCPSILINLFDDPQEVIAVELSDLLVSYMDYPNKRYSSRLGVLIPSIIFQVIKYTGSTKKVLAHLKTSLNLHDFCQKINLDQVLKLKQEHIHLNDAPFHRDPYLLFEENRDATYEGAYGCIVTSLSLPNANYPLLRSNYEFTERPSTTSAQSEYYLGRNNADFYPTCNYDDEDFMPDYFVDQGIEYDNYIFEFSDTEVILTPMVLMVMAKLVGSLNESTLQTLVDELQIDIVTCLKKLMKPLHEVRNFRVVLPELSVKIGEFDFSDALEVAAKDPQIPVINFVLSEASLALSWSEKKGAKEHLVNAKEEFTIAFHLKEMFFSVSNPEVDFSLPVFVTLEDFEFWSEFSNVDTLVASPSIKSIRVEVEDSQISWLYDYVVYMHSQIDPAIELLQSRTKDDKEKYAELVYKLTLASTSYNINYDPEVLTKPAYILRTKKDHVRYYDGWKIMARLKHVYDNFPDRWKEENRNTIEDINWRLPSTAYDEVKNIFSKWRGWEANEEQRTFFFNYIFEIQENQFFNGVSLHILIENIEFKVASSDDNKDFFKIHNTSMICLLLPQEKKFNELGLNIDASNDLEISVNFEKISSRVSKILFNFIADVCKIYNKQEKVLKKKLKPETDSDKSNIEISAVVNVNKYDLSLIMPTGSIQMLGSASRTCADILMLEDFSQTPSFSISTQTEVFEVLLWYSSAKMFSFTMNEFVTTATNVGSIQEGVKLCEIGAANVSLEILDNEKLLEFLHNLKEKDLVYYKELFALKEIDQAKDADEAVVEQKVDETKEVENAKEDNEKGELDKRELTLKFDIVGDFSVKLKIGRIAFMAEVLVPLRLFGEVSGLEISGCKAGNMFSTKNCIKNIQGNAKINNVLVLEAQASELRVDGKLNWFSNHLLTILNSSVGYSKIHIPQLINSLTAYLTNEDLIIKRIQDLKGLSNNSGESILKSKAENEMEASFKLKFSVDYFGLSTFVHKSKFSFELEESLLGLFNIDNVLLQNLDSSYIKVPLYGEIGIQSIRFNVLDKSIHMSVSQILEMNISAKIFNDVDTQFSLQILQIKSQYCRVCLSAPVLFKLVSLVDTAVSFTKMLDKRHSSPVPEETKSSPINIFSKFSSIQILSHNFCIGWITAESRKDYPGIIIGAERFFAVSEKDLGKYTLIEAYLSVANGSRSSNFYSTTSPKSSLNRAYLPKMQLIYSIEEVDNLKNMHVFVNGDEVDVKFLSNSVVMLEQLVSSANEVQSFFKHRQQVNPNQITKKGIQDKKELFHSTFNVVEFQAKFAGSRILFCHIDDPEADSPGSLFLQSPAVMIAAKYKHQKAEKKKHLLKIDILTSSSENTVYSSCVPIVMDLVQGMKSMMKKSNPAPKEESASQGPDLGQMFNDIDLHLGIKIEKHVLTLSCEPTAKVAAIVGIDGIHIQVNSHPSEMPTIFAAVYFDLLSASLQHIYSREISGSAKIEKIILTATLEFGEKQSLLTSGSLVNVEGYVNMKQYQDLELFKDIWIPKKYFETNDKVGLRSVRANASNLATNKSISNRFKEVSTTYAFPWVMTFIMTNANIKVDFGQALGIFNLQLDNLWVISKKSSNWSQELQLGTNRILLQSKGRLGADFAADNINLYTAIAWKLGDGVTLDVPLILISGGIDKVSLKLSFDSHVFALAYIKVLSMDIFNQKNEISITKDHLLVKFYCEAAEAYATSLTASNFWDIHNTISRMMQEKRSSYKETLRDSSGGAVRPKLNKTLTDDILETVKKLESNILLTFGHLLIYVYPSSFDDSKVLVLKLDESRANFQQNEYLKGISNELEIKFNDLIISLSKCEDILEEFVNTCTVEEFIEVAHKAKGGNIFLFPSFKISMRSFQKYKDHIVEYLYQSSFGGTVDIRWNLGSVNFIREMISIHTRALKSRTSYDPSKELKTEVGEKAEEPIIKPEVESDPTEEIEQAIEDRITKVAQESKYTYVPLAPPIIAAPQLKELGNATPPLEWFGLHRNKFPNFTHQIGIVSLQKLIHEVELQYSKLLGKA